jgi:hypothetical protein
MIRLPLGWADGLLRLVNRRPGLLASDVADSPFLEEMSDGFLYREVRGGYPKWAHLKCPKCGEQISLPIGGSRESWKLRIDWLRRPTLHPSVWETESCGAHFFVRAGKIEWCRDERRLPS